MRQIGLRRTLALLPVLVAAALLAGSRPAEAQSLAQTTAAVNLRAGPGTRYEVLTTVPAGASVSVYSCNSGYSWCDIDYAGQRGYVAGKYLTSNAQGAYYGSPLPSVGVYLGLPLFWDSYPVYRPGWPGYYPPGYRPPGWRPPDYRPPGNRPPGWRPPGQRPPDARPPRPTPPIARPPGQRPPGVRPPGRPRPPSARPPGQRPPSFRPPGGGRPGMGRPGGGRPSGGRGGGGRGGGRR
ncbi:SH3 domain-containing protein [Stappia sp. F7233]|uniref:SH3 domain-containing protein n=1 Tax=Stappia albiluteola TaxID=2758565 RepID=A0A839AFX7_9HYPH|nr:SH3 domain-containing protein [Stappia albiluteola]MBA5778561.1 SH3 domain-containing protein [Stappia albiluteola]